MIKLGSYVEDRVTGITGVADNRATFLYGVDRYCVQPRALKDGTVPGSLMVDEPQLKVLKKKLAMKPLPEPEQLIKLGTAVTDPIYGRSGVAIGRAVYLNGCARILVEAKLSKLIQAGATQWWVYEEQLETNKTLGGKEKVVVKEQKKKPTGGPAPSNSKY